MRNFSKAFRRLMFDDERVFLAYADITLSNNTVLHLTNEEIWSGGFVNEDAVSEDESFTAVGSVVIGSAEIVINNIYEDYSSYDFVNAEVVLWIGLTVGSSVERAKIGTYRVDDATYNGATIKLSLLDNIEQFDRSYSASTLVYPATLFQIVQEACTKCGVTLANNSQTFPHYQYEIPTKPTDESLTFREVLSWCATIAGCFAKCNSNGELVFGWFDTALLDESANDLDGGTFNPWSTGDTYSGGTFDPWTEGDSYDGGNLSSERKVHYITNLWSQDIAMDDVVITGVVAQVEDNSNNATQEIITYSTGTTGYQIEIEPNDFITKTNAQEIVNWLGTQLIGLRFRKLNVSHISDPSIESGDVAIVIDRKQNVYRVLVTRVAFSITGNQTTVCGAETPSRNNATRYSGITKAYVEARKQLRREQSLREQAVQQLSSAIASSSGLYTTIVTQQDNSKIYYLHDKSALADSSIVWKMNGNAWAVTNDWQGDDASTTSAGKWNAGLTVDGTLIASILSANGISADWIDTGVLSFNRCSGGILQLGGSNNVKGVLQLYDSNGNITAQLNNDVFYIGDRARYADSSASIWKTKDGTVISEGGILNCDNDTIAVLRQGTLAFAKVYHGSGMNYTDRGVVYATGSIENTPIDTQLHLQCYWGSIVCEYHDYLYANNLVVANASTKSKLVESKNFGNRLLYCYEMPTPYFGDIGTGQINENGESVIDIDSIFDESINVGVEYSVFLQKEGSGDIWIDEKQSDYFVVKGTPNLKFSWELKAVQKNFETYRLDDIDINPQSVVPYDEDIGMSLDFELEQLDTEVLFEEVF